MSGSLRNGNSRSRENQPKKRSRRSAKAYWKSFTGYGTRHRNRKNVPPATGMSVKTTDNRHQHRRFRRCVHREAAGYFAYPAAVAYRCNFTMLLQFIFAFQSNISSQKLSTLSLTTRELLWSFAMPCAIIYSE